MSNQALNTERYKNIFPETSLNEFQRMVEVDRSNMREEMLDLPSHMHKVVRLMAQCRMMNNNLEEKMRKKEYEIYLDLRMNSKVKFSNKTDMRIAIEADLEWNQIQQDVQHINTKLEFLTDIKNLLTQKSYALDFALKYDRFTNGDR